jgi:hypothetical protein
VEEVTAATSTTERARELSVMSADVELAHVALVVLAMQSLGRRLFEVYGIAGDPERQQLHFQRVPAW